ncbi:YlxR family protein [Oceanidesulfovibrio marinus]|uniref:DUF448 domain-containing protein n=1 Tax=Oceanidesulfovibrio marinus TaxID=370038 RepID=A0A6P1ZI63_9BACT|nr:YlxR family protein [Oceanidesulfovibrio marinus]TVM34271.1 DUF448 domain-containing protein [Oceanidesulfovibrio marinus]
MHDDARAETKRRVPERTCTVCRAKRPKSELLRFVAGEDGLVPDPKQILPGRGCYVCLHGECKSQLRQGHCRPRKRRG